MKLMRYNNRHNKYRKVDRVRVTERGKSGAAGKISMPSQNEKRPRAIGSETQVGTKISRPYSATLHHLAPERDDTPCHGGAYLGLERFTIFWLGGDW